MGNTDEEEALEYRILLGLYIDRKESEKRREILSSIAIGDPTPDIRCHGCGDTIEKGKRFIAFHNKDEIVRYTQSVLNWKEGRTSKKW